MKRFLASIFAVCSLLPLSAQYTTDGYYRVQNYARGRYIYVTDNTGSYSTSGVEDFGAIQLWKNLDRAISDPGSVIYITKQGENKYDLLSQGTGMKKLSGYNVNIYATTSGLYKGTYQVYASTVVSGVEVTKYLTDNESSNIDDGVLGTNGTGAYRQWKIIPLSESSDNYFGITPKLSVGDKYYQPFYADFPFEFQSEGMKAYYISIVDGSIAVISDIEGVVPASTPVIIECSSQNPSDNRLKLLPPSTKGAEIKTNLLSGTFFANPERRRISKDCYVPFDMAKTRTLGINKEGKLAFVSGKSNFITSTQISQKEFIDAIAANTSFLSLPSDAPAELVIMTEEEYRRSAVGTVSADKVFDGRVFDLMGRELNSADSSRKGVYIMNGKKYIK